MKTIRAADAMPTGQRVITMDRSCQEDETVRYEPEQARAIARKAVAAAGASDDIAKSLADAVVSAELAGNRAVGFAHLPDYLDGFVKGRIARDAQPDISSPAPSVLRSDARGGIAQLGFDRGFDEFVARTDTHGVAVFVQSNSFTVGELGYYTRRLAEAGLVALATCNASALMTTVESRQAVYGTNPLSFAAPLENARPFVLDQASSATAFVNIRRAAERGESIPDGWAVDASGNPTTDAREAVKGLLLAFGGARGANIALVTEILAAGMTGANWSMDAPSFAEGDQSPGVGLFIVAFKPELCAPGFRTRLAAHIDRLAAAGVRIPGSHVTVREIDVAPSVMAAVEEFRRT
jgi:(2R)-3-sulfolactate dehydrogenase (NADP+)